MMKAGFRASMLWLHTWSGLVMGWLLFAVFLTGTIVFFRNEINYWMTPELHQSVPHEGSAVVAIEHLAAIAPNAEQWQINLPDDRGRVLEVRWQNPGQEGGRRAPSQTLDASTGEILEPRETAGADFLYIFHFELYGIPREVGRWIIGIATMLMFIAMISGVLLHKNIFRDFFSFRTRKSLRGFLDAHAITAVFALPFHIMITFSGLVLLAGTLLFWNNEPRQFRGGGSGGGEPEQVVAEVEASADYLLPPVDYPLPPIMHVLAQAEAYWGQPVSSVAISDPLIGQSEISVSPAFGDRFSNGRGGGRRLYFDGEGNLLHEVPTRTAENGINAVYNSLVILHQGRFSAPFLRWLFFIAGVLGTIMVGTGMVYWSQKRQKKQLGKFGYELVCAINVSSIAGLCVATGAYFWANRLFPADLAVRPDWEITSFFLTWLLCLMHSIFYRHREGWIHQFSLAAALFALIPLLDGMTSSTGVLYAIANADWIRISFDLVCLLFGVVFGLTAYYLWAKAPEPGTASKKTSDKRASPSGARTALEAEA